MTKIDDNRSYRQTWTPMKICCYLIYRAIAKHIPDELGLIGIFSNALRRIVCRPLLRESAKMIGIGPGVDFGNGCTLVMKEHANIGKSSLIDSGGGLITIGRHVMMGNQCIIIGQNHNYLEEGYDGFIKKDVVIGDYAWLGHRVIILPGVMIGKHAIVGAGTVVTKNIPDYAIAAGNPARVIKYRKS